MSYFIKKIENNKYNLYQYHYLDHMTAVIDIRDNYWAFDIDLHSINDFSLPVNSLAGTLQLPYQQIEDITFTYNTDQSTAQSGVEYNKNYARLYSTHFEVDVSQNQYLKQDLNNIKLLMELSLYIDPEAAKGAGTDIEQDALDKLINETSEQRWSFEMYYSNTYLIQQNGAFDNINGFSLPFGHECIATSREIIVKTNLLNNLTQSFDNLVSLFSNAPFQVLTAKVKFNYWIGYDGQQKVIEKVLDIDRNVTTRCDINLNDYTLYDFDRDEIIFDPVGTKGFYLPKLSQGNYEVELQILQSNTISKVVISNNFNFITSEIKPYIVVAQRYIDNLDGFKEVNLND